MKYIVLRIVTLPNCTYRKEGWVRSENSLLCGPPGDELTVTQSEFHPERRNARNLAQSAWRRSWRGITRLLARNEAGFRGETMRSQQVAWRGNLKLKSRRGVRIRSSDGSALSADSLQPGELVDSIRRANPIGLLACSVKNAHQAPMCQQRLLRYRTNLRLFPNVRSRTPSEILISEQVHELISTDCVLRTWATRRHSAF